MNLKAEIKVDRGLRNSVVCGVITAALVFLSLVVLLAPPEWVTNISKSWCGAVASYAVLVGLIVARRGENPSTLDRFLCSGGFIALFVVHLILYPVVWYLRGYFA